MRLRVIPAGRRALRNLCLGILGAGAAHSASIAQTPWQYAGGNLSNTHAALSDANNQGTARQISPNTAPNLKVKWQFTTSGDVSATPTVEAGGLYVPDWGGMLYKLDPGTGALIWSHAVCDYTSTCYTATSSISRTAPAIGAKVIVIGDLMAHYDRSNYGAVVIGVDKATGNKIWSTIINTSSLYASVVGSPVVYNGVAYVGTASWEEGIAGTSASFQPTFIGNITALNVNTGEVLWKFHTAPSGYTGAAVTGGSFAVWPANNSLLVSTGNNYSIPAGAATCVANAGPTLAAQKACLDPTDYIDALLSLDLTTGRLIWARRVAGFDTYTTACYSPPAANCPTPTGLDEDFGQAPMLTFVPNFTGVADDRGGTSNGYWLGAGRKDSTFYALNPTNGGLFWSKAVGVGGMEWGSAINTDDFDTIFVAIHNASRVSQTIGGVNNANLHAWNGGVWEAMDLKTGKSKWSIQPVGADLANPAASAITPGCMSFTNRVVFAGSTSGYFVAMDAASGTKYWYYASGGTVNSCPAIFNETVYWGTGYARAGVGAHTLYAFSVNGA